MNFWKRFFGIAEEKRLPPIDLSYNEDYLYPDAAEYVISTGNCSISALQRQFKIGYNRAVNLIEALEADYIISEPQSGSRRILSEEERRYLRSRPSEAEQYKMLRLSYLMEKYRDEKVVRMIMERVIWEGMSTEHLFDALGSPEAIDQKYFKQASREVWKYHHQGGNRYSLRITLENGNVVGWDAKQVG